MPLNLSNPTVIVELIIAVCVIAVCVTVYLVQRKQNTLKLRKHFGSEYDAYFARTWRLIPGLY